MWHCIPGPPQNPASRSKRRRVLRHPRRFAQAPVSHRTLLASWRPYIHYAIFQHGLICGVILCFGVYVPICGAVDSDSGGVDSGDCYLVGYDGSILV